MENSLHKQASDAFKKMIRIYIDVQHGDMEFRTQKDHDSFFEVYKLFKADHLVVAIGLDDDYRNVVARRMTDRASYYKSALREKASVI